VKKTAIDDCDTVLALRKDAAALKQLADLEELVDVPPERGGVYFSDWEREFIKSVRVHFNLALFFSTKQRENWQPRILAAARPRDDDPAPRARLLPRRVTEAGSTRPDASRGDGPPRRRPRGADEHAEEPAAAAAPSASAGLADDVGRRPVEPIHEAVRAGRSKVRGPMMQETTEEAAARRRRAAVALVKAKLWDASVHPDHGVVIYWHERIWRVMGGDVVAPSLMGLVGLRVGEVQWVVQRERQEPVT
jgi:hypothetical protein